MTVRMRLKQSSTHSLLSGGLVAGYDFAHHLLRTTLMPGLRTLGRTNYGPGDIELFLKDLQ